MCGEPPPQLRCLTRWVLPFGCSWPGARPAEARRPGALGCLSAYPWTAGALLRIAPIRRLRRGLPARTQDLQRRGAADGRIARENAAYAAQRPNSCAAACMD